MLGHQAITQGDSLPELDYGLLCPLFGEIEEVRVAAADDRRIGCHFDRASEVVISIIESMSEDMSLGAENEDLGQERMETLRAGQ